jgi:ribonucleases P/MRP protein subunit RPP40
LSRKSACTQLLTTLNEWSKAADDNKRVDAVYIDFAKAFDSVSHPKLLHKVSKYGVGYELLNWIREFLRNRLQYVRIENDVSDFAPVIGSILQGSVLGPVLFNLFINDVTDCLVGSTEIKLFADDIKLYYCRTDCDASDLQKTLDNFCIWAKKWQLNVAFEKCCSISFGNKKLPSCTFLLSDYELPVVDAVKDLGIMITTNLKPSSHCSQTAAKMYMRCKLLLKTFYTVNTRVLVQGFKTYVRPLGECSVQAWNPWLLKDIDCLEKVQKYFTRSILRKANVAYTNYKHRLQILGLQSLEYRRLQFDLCMCYKILTKAVEVDSSTMFTIDKGLRNTRGHSMKLKQSFCRLEVRQHFFSQKIVKIWNSLPEEIASAKSVKHFKLLLSRHQLDRFCSRP